MEIIYDKFRFVKEKYELYDALTEDYASTVPIDELDLSDLENLFNSENIFVILRAEILNEMCLKIGYKFFFEDYDRYFLYCASRGLERAQEYN